MRQRKNTDAGIVLNRHMKPYPALKGIGCDDCSMLEALAKHTDISNRGVQSMITAQ
jgi:hypothetical protein